MVLPPNYDERMLRREFLGRAAVAQTQVLAHASSPLLAPDFLKKRRGKRAHSEPASSLNSSSDAAEAAQNMPHAADQTERAAPQPAVKASHFGTSTELEHDIVPLPRTRRRMKICPEPRATGQEVTPNIQPRRSPRLVYKETIQASKLE